MSHNSSSLFKAVDIVQQVGGHQEISHLCFDSRQAKAGSLFFAIPGTQVDGHQFLPQVFSQGCKACVVEKIPDVVPDGVLIFQVHDSNEAMALVASAFYGNPSTQLNLVGITGTNGKTTSVTLLFELFKALGHRCGLISTVQNQIDEEIIPSTHTTPDAVNLNKLLAEMVEAGCTNAFMEVTCRRFIECICKREHTVIAVQVQRTKFSNRFLRTHVHVHIIWMLSHY